jgi:hypothetical protein
MSENFEKKKKIIEIKWKTLKEQVWAHKTSLTPPLFIVPNKECRQKCTYAINIDFVSFYVFFIGLRNCYDNWIIFG